MDDEQIVVDTRARTEGLSMLSAVVLRKIIPAIAAATIVGGGVLGCSNQNESAPQRPAQEQAPAPLASPDIKTEVRVCEVDEGNGGDKNCQATAINENNIGTRLFTPEAGKVEIRYQAVHGTLTLYTTANCTGSGTQVLHAGNDNADKIGPFDNQSGARFPCAKPGDTSK